MDWRVYEQSITLLLLLLNTTRHYHRLTGHQIAFERRKNVFGFCIATYCFPAVCMNVAEILAVVVVGGRVIPPAAAAAEENPNEKLLRRTISSPDKQGVVLFQY